MTLYSVTRWGPIGWHRKIIEKAFQATVKIIDFNGKEASGEMANLYFPLWNIFWSVQEKKIRDRDLTKKN